MSIYKDIKYKGGHPKMPKPFSAIIETDTFNKEITIKNAEFFGLNEKVVLDYDEIIHISFDEKSKRSAGKAVIGAIVGGLLTGGIGFLAGAAFGGKKKDVSDLYLTIKYNDHEFDIILHTGKNTEKIYAEIIGMFT
ncbi:MAG: hypothetical protein Q7U47_03120 [Paludibacter sp.]|nr:hypothetical protein [Paludibacter sp.]